MSLQYRVADQVLRADDTREATEEVVHKYDAFLNLLCAERYAFQRGAIRSALRFLVSDKYHFYFLSPEDYTHFFERVRGGAFAGWTSGVMSALDG